MASCDATLSYKQIDLEKNSTQQNQQLMQQCLTSYKNAFALYRLIKSPAHERKLQALINKMDGYAQLYRQLPTTSQAISKLLATSSAADKQKATELLKPIIRFYSTFKAGSLVQASQLAMNEAMVLMGMLQGQTYLNNYIASSPTSSNPAYNIAVKSGIAASDSTLLRQAAQAYAKGYQEYLSYLKALPDLSQPAITLPMQAISKAMSAVVQAQALCAQGTQSAKLLSLDGLTQAQQKYDAARVALADADTQFLADSNLAPYLPIYPALIAHDQAMTYNKAFNNYIGALYVDICKPIYQKDPAVALQYYASIASYGVDMSSAIAQIQSAVNLVQAAQSAASDARTISANVQSWAAQPNVQGYASVANTAWSKAMSLYEAAIANGATQAVGEYIDFLKEYTGLFLTNVPQQYLPILGALLIYHHAYMQYINQPNAAVAIALQTNVNNLVQQAKTQLNQLSTQLEGLAAQGSVQNASNLETMIVTYYTAIFPDTNLSALGLADADIKAAQVRLANAAKALGSSVLNTNYQQAYQQLSLARLTYQQAGRTDLAEDETFKQQYFLAQTLATAWVIESQIVADGKDFVGSFTVPQRYYLTEYTQPIPQGVPTDEDARTIAKYIYVAYCLNDQNISYEQVYNSGTTQMVSGLDQDTITLVKNLEQAADKFVQASGRIKGYSAQIIDQNGTPVLKEVNKWIPAVDAPYTSAPIAIGYYYSALMLYRPGTDLVTFQNQAFVPGQNDDKAWQMGYNIATTLMSSAADYSNQLNKQQKWSVDAIKNQVSEIYNRLNVAQEYLNGKDHTVDFQGQSKFATQANLLNYVIAQQLESCARTVTRYITKDLADDDIKALCTEADNDYMMAREYFIAYANVQNGDFTVTDANKIMLLVAQLYTKVGQLFMNKNEYFFASPYLGSASYQYQQLLDNSVTLGAPATAQQQVEEQLNEAYFKGAAQRAVSFAQAIQVSPVVDNLSFAQLIDKRNSSDTSGSFLTQEEFDKYNELDGMILDALTYYLMSNDEYGKLVSPQAQKTANQQANQIVNNYLTGNGFNPNQLATLKLQNFAVAGFNEFSKNADEDLRNALLSTWAFQLYNSLSQIYISYYLSTVSADQQLPQLNDRINARLQSTTFGS